MIPAPGVTSCGRCKWWRPLDQREVDDPFSSNPLGNCCRYAPRGHSLPATQAEQWCGEFERKVS